MTGIQLDLFTFAAMQTQDRHVFRLFLLCDT